VQIFATIYYKYQRRTLQGHKDKDNDVIIVPKESLRTRTNMAVHRANCIMVQLVQLVAAMCRQN